MDSIGDRWRKSSYSGGNGGDCVEVGHDRAVIAVRDTKDRTSVLTFNADAWTAFAATIKQD